MSAVSPTNVFLVLLLLLWLDPLPPRPLPPEPRPPPLPLPPLPRPLPPLLFAVAAVAVLAGAAVDAADVMVLLLLATVPGAAALGVALLFAIVAWDELYVRVGQQRVCCLL